MTFPTRRVPFGSFVLSTLIVTSSPVVVISIFFHESPSRISCFGLVTETVKSASSLGIIS